MRNGLEFESKYTLPRPKGLKIQFFWTPWIIRPKVNPLVGKWACFRYKCNDNFCAKTEFKHAKLFYVMAKLVMKEYTLPNQNSKDDVTKTKENVKCKLSYWPKWPKGVLISVVRHFGPSRYLIF